MLCLHSMKVVSVLNTGQYVLYDNYLHYIGRTLLISHLTLSTLYISPTSLVMGSTAIPDTVLICQLTGGGRGYIDGPGLTMTYRWRERDIDGPGLTTTYRWRERDIDGPGLTMTYRWREGIY